MMKLINNSAVYLVSKEVPMNNWSLHPRPQLQRDSYYILKDNWSLNRMPITMPYPPRSILSGYNHGVGSILNYKCKFTIPPSFTKKRILLHFGAVDQLATVRLNGKHIGDHEGGYTPFFFDVTDEINRYGENILEVIATDKLDTDYPYGKQSNNPSGMWYTPVSGIWQNVWIENVPDTYISYVKYDTDTNSVNITLDTSKNISEFILRINMPDGSELTKIITGNSGILKIYHPVNWTVDNPYLYRCSITCEEDTIESYFALRTISIEKIKGINRVCLNGKPIFLHGVLDQGYFHNGIFLPESETDYDKDILNIKGLGFNTLRKHIKVEPEYFYYACDKLGMLVMQDMVNSGEYSYNHDTLLPSIGFKKLQEGVLTKESKRRQIFEKQMALTINHVYNHPSVIAYTIFNEGWGQFNSDEMYALAKKLDPSRLVDSTSGWFAQNDSDFDSEHVYFRNKALKPKDRPMFITECGGYKLMVPDHYFGKKEYGYGTCKDSDELMTRMETMYEKMIIPGIPKGICGCIYTQLSDVEGEINGLYTYDREVCKVDKERMLRIKDKLTFA